MFFHGKTQDDRRIGSVQEGKSIYNQKSRENVKLESQSDLPGGEITWLPKNTVKREKRISMDRSRRETLVAIKKHGKTAKQRRKALCGSTTNR